MGSKDIENPKNYREKYKRYFGIDFGKEYVVHHIDGNRENNSIDNLVLLPQSLHARYHMTKAIVKDFFEKTNLEIVGERYYDYSFERKMMDIFFDAWKECNKWFDYKESGYNGVFISRKDDE